MRADRPPGENRRVPGLDRPYLDGRVLSLEDFADSAQSSACANARAETVYRLRRLLHYLERGAMAVRRRVRRIRELLGDEHLRILLGHSLRYRGAFGYGVANVASVMDKHHFRAVVAHKLAAFFADAVGHDNDRPVALHRADESESYALVSASGLDYHGVGPEQPARLGVTNHVERRTGLYGAANVHCLELYKDFGHVGRRHPTKPHQRRMSQRVKYAVADHLSPFFCFLPFPPFRQTGELYQNRRRKFYQ